MRFRPRVVYSRGAGCAELAEILAGDQALKASGDLAEDCRNHRADLHVARKLTGFDLVSTAVPTNFEPDSVESVVATVAGGPHSVLAAEIAAILGERLAVPAKIISIHRTGDDLEAAKNAIAVTSEAVPQLETSVVEIDKIRRIGEVLEGESLLVFGAPGGSFLTRQIFGAGARLRSGSPGGKVLVRRAPPRVFQHMDSPVFVGALREASDALALHPEDVLAVADDSRLVGVVRRSDLASAPPGTTVESVMGEPIAASVDDAIDDLFENGSWVGENPLPVIDDQGNLVGSLVLDGMSSRSDRAS
ncbi:MAG: hypothetical protein GEU79_00755 [Acidimicrobiia bacterium]|nr:hypothetical protein [Acidimicrobiia bacterium]